jgi:hypothetical protein
MVAVFLLHAGGFSGLRPGLPERDAFGVARGSEGVFGEGDGSD